tara:strand:+ start:3064 stop:3828 length:765 start_codon:yes stop_codon:yes gene_type:complete
MKTIGLYGDSFVEVLSEDKKQYVDEKYYSLKSWPKIVADKFKLDIVHSGKGGTSYWDIPINQFVFKDCPDVLIFCWSSSARLYSKDGLHLHPTPGKKWWGQQQDKIDKHLEASNLYFKYLHDYEKELLEYKSCLYWFDNAILDKIPSDRKIVHLWSFGHMIDFDREDKYHPENLRYLHNWKNGVEIRPSCMSVALMDNCNINDVDSYENHMNTQEKHNLMADFVMHSLIDTNVNGGYDRDAMNDYTENLKRWLK